MNTRSLNRWWVLGGLLAPAGVFAQVPDVVTALDAGGRAMGMGGVTYATGADTTSNFYNPAGLGLIDRATIGLTARNMPESRTVVTGDIGPGGQQRLSSDGRSGANGLGHLGVAIPLKSRGGKTNGTIGISLTQAGQLRDERVAGPGLVEGGLDASGYRQLLKLDTDMINVSYGRANADGTFSWGVGLVWAQTRQVNNKLAPSGATNFDALSTGLGAQIGILLSPKDNSDMSFGISYRTPIKLRTGSDSPLFFGTIPGRLAAGVAVRRDGFRGGRDFMVMGLEGQYHHGGKDSFFVDRSSQMILGVGVEYNYAFSTYRIPVRLGYQAVAGGGDFFDRRDALTFGFGFRPVTGDWGIDLNFGRPQGGGNDASVGITYRFK